MIAKNKRHQNKMPIRGKISCGFKAYSEKTKTEYPKATDHFVIKDPRTQEVLYPELIEIYGEKPTEFIVAFQSNNIEDFFNDDNALWGGNNKRRRKCDLETCKVFVEETIDGTTYEAGKKYPCICETHELLGLKAKAKEGDLTKAEKERMKKLCKREAYLRTWILHPEIGKPLNPFAYLIETHSEHSADGIEASLTAFQNLGGKFIDRKTVGDKVMYMTASFRLSVKPVSDNLQTYPIIDIKPIVEDQKYLDYVRNMVYQHKQLTAGNADDDEPIIAEEKTVVDAQVEEVPQESDWLPEEGNTGEYVSCIFAIETLPQLYAVEKHLKGDTKLTDPQREKVQERIDKKKKELQK